MTFSPESIIALLILLVALFAGVVIAIVALVKVFAPDLAKGIPPEVFNRVLDFEEKVLEFGLNRAALTSDLGDDQFYIEGLKLLGYQVTGSPETGYHVTPPQAAPSAAKSGG